VNEVVDAPLPDACPDCKEAIEGIGVKPQYQEDIPPVTTWVTQFNVAIGRCLGCRKRIQGRHPRQTSNALGAAASHLGPRALAIAAVLNKQLGLSFAKVSSLFRTLFSLTVTRGGLCLALHRLAKAAKPSYNALVESVRTSAVVAPDETGWRMNGQSWWLWAFVGDSSTVYAILPGRGYEEAASILGEDFAGTLERDGWAPYRKFTQAKHQSCLNHLKNRCHRLLETAKRGAARVPHAVKRILNRAFELRKHRERYSPHGWAVELGKLSARLKRLLRWKPKDDENRKFLKHLSNEQDALFTCLRETGVAATNWRAEQAIRPAVVTRKACGGNRTPQGAMTQQILASVLRTCDQRKLDFVAVVEDNLRSDPPRVALMLQPTRGP
jgi:transposase